MATALVSALSGVAVRRTGQQENHRAAVLPMAACGKDMAATPGVPPL
ncbi:MAG: hypothetical protein ACLSAP_06010 [Oscillospiraceae bacterium]